MCASIQIIAAIRSPHRPDFVPVPQGQRKGIALSASVHALFNVKSSRPSLTSPKFLDNGKTAQENPAPDPDRYQEALES